VSALAEIRPPTLALDRVVVDYHRRHQPIVRAVADVSMQVHTGEVHGLVGESGCGKSTLARAVTGLVPLTSGSIVFDGQQVTPLSRRPRVRHFRRLQMVFQDPYSSLNPRRTVSSQLADALRRAGGVPANRRRARIAELLDTVGIAATSANRLPGEFSGGQRQRICIARALAADPMIVIADEPISSLDASAQAQIANLLFSLTRELGLGVLLISHDLAIVQHVADVVSVMYLGKVVEHAPKRPLWERPLHPYTEALLAAAPAHDGEGVLAEGLPGEIPDPADPPSGCRFHPRCRHAFEPCPGEEPMLVTVGPGRSCACWLRAPVTIGGDGVRGRPNGDG
jgi:oligopeptide/dipeptide ABC transporter ATP-binding protein